MTDKLKPCPFCGGSAEQPTPEAPHGGMVQCVSCGASAFGPKWNRRVVYVSAGITAAFADNQRDIEALRAACELVAKSASYRMDIGAVEACRFALKQLDSPSFPPTE